jgi:homoserine kinase
MNDPEAIRVRVPASSANLGPGFDTLALALGLYLECTLRASESGFLVRVSGEDASGIPPDETNLTWRAFLRLAGARAPRGLTLEIANDIPVGKGLGSSAAAIVAGLALANEWLELGKSREELVQLAAEIEGHPDNVAAAAWGGLVVSCQSENGQILAVKLRPPAALEVVLAIPEFQLSTTAARAALPAQYSRQDAVFNVQRVALLLAALADGRADLFREAMRDRLHQPYRAPLIPGLEDILRLRDVPGLLGVALSGAGPSVIAFCSGHADEIGAAMVACFRAKNIAARARRLAVDTEGVVVERILV